MVFHGVHLEVPEGNRKREKGKKHHISVTLMSSTLRRMELNDFYGASYLAWKVLLRPSVRLSNSIYIGTRLCVCVERVDSLDCGGAAKKKS